MPAAELAALDAALAARTAPVTLWWRDDDAGRPDPRLDRLLALAARHQAPLALAVVPAWLEPKVAANLLAAERITILQHGHAHRSHAGAGERKIELGGTADRARLTADLIAGRELLRRSFGDRFRPVMVPPWNRIAPDVRADLTAAGFHGLSTFAGDAAADVDGLPRIDTHLDVIDWRGDRGFRDLGALLLALAELVRRPVLGPIGLLTHHLVTDDAGFETLDRLLALVQDRPALALLSALDLFTEPG